VNREVTTWIFFLVIFKLQGGPKSDEIWHIFRPQSSHVYTESAEYAKPRKCRYTLRDLRHTCLGSGHSPSPVGRADCMYLHRRPCVWLPFAAACCYTLSCTDDACSSSNLSTTVIKFSIFSDPTRRLSAPPPELRRIR